MIHPTAIVEIANVDPTTNVWAYAHILAGAEIGRHVNIGDHAFIEGGAVVGDNATIKNAVCIWRGVHIDRDVFVGPRVTFTNDRHPRSPRMASVHDRYAVVDQWLAPTHVGVGCSLGAAATICPGIRLGPFSMIAAGAVVTRDVAPYALVAGVPARQIGSVCSCGYTLPGPFDVVVCGDCGETPGVRNEFIESLAGST